MLEPGRQFNAEAQYRYGFNGKEQDNDIDGTGVDYDYGMRIYDARAGKFLSVDPIENEYPYFSPYAFAGNTPVWAVDLDGAEILTLGTGGILAGNSGLTIGEAVAEGGGAVTDVAPAPVTGPSTGGWSQFSQWRVGTQGLFRSPYGLIDVIFVPPHIPLLKKPYPGQGIKQAPQKNPAPNPQPQRQYDPTKAPTKEDNGDDGVYIYETGGTDKIRKGLIDKSAGTLPYFGITSNPFKDVSGARYPSTHERAINYDLYRGIIGKTNSLTALGVEAALIALNTYGKKFDQLAESGKMSSTDVMNSTRIDNKNFRTKLFPVIELGIAWLDIHKKGWRDTFYHPQKAKGPNHPKHRKQGG